MSLGLGLGLVDTHAHVMDPAFDADRAQVLERAHAAGVDGLVLVGYDASTSRAAVELAVQLDGTVASVGIHPNSVAAAAEADWQAVEALAAHPSVAAIGETGLDYYRDYTPPPEQQRALEWHLRLAETHRLPVIVHNRQADLDVADALERSAARRPVGDVPGVLHCFASTDATYLGRMLAAGYYVSFAGNLTFKNAHAVREAAASVPLERLLVETDCPFMAPVPHRGRRNEPGFVADTARCLAEIHAISFEHLVDSLWRNSTRVFPSLVRTPLLAGVRDA